MRRPLRAALLSALFAAVALSGCVSPPASPDVEVDAGASVAASLSLADPILSQSSYAISGPERVDVASFDGVLVNQYVWKPKTDEAGQTFPVIINSSPYFSNLETPARFGGDDFSWWLVEFFVPRGYIVAVQSVRGTGESGGCFNLGGMTEMKDMYETVEYFGTKYAGTNGKVGVIGKSYDGTTPHMASVLQPPHLATIVPIAGITDWYRYLNTNGVPYTGRSVFNTQYTLTVDWGLEGGFTSAQAALREIQNNFDHNPRETLTREENSRNWANSLCKDLVDHTSAAARTEATGSYNEWWTERNYRKDLAKVNVPVFLVHGMQDWNVKPDQFGDWYDRLTVPKRALLGQWAHDYPLRFDWNATLLAWFDWTLKGIDNGISTGATVQIEDSSGRWRTEEDWPPKAVVMTDYYFSTFGSMGSATPGGPGAHATAAYMDAPTGELTDEMDPVWGSLVFETPPFDADTLVSGLPKVALFASFERPAARLAIGEYLVTANGTSNEINRAFLSAAHRSGPENAPEPLMPGEVYRLEMNLFPEDTLIPAGSRLRFVVTGLHGWVEPLPTGGMVTLHFGGDVASKITLPIVSDAMSDDPQPLMLKRGDVPGNRPRPAPDRN